MIYFQTNNNMPHKCTIRVYHDPKRVEIELRANLFIWIDSNTLLFRGYGEKVKMNILNFIRNIENI